jgi:hypothetical protein
MVKHIVMFKLAENTPANRKRATEALESLRGHIETLRHLEVGEDYLASERSFDLVLITHFDDREGLRTYAGHEHHLPVVDTMRGLCSQSVSVDFEC